MKKNVFLIRHAAAEEGGSSTVMRDYDRELTSQGIMQAAKVGKQLKDQKIKIDAIYTSGAKRAVDTANYLTEQGGFNTENLKVSEVLYGNGPRGYMEVVNSIPNDIKSVIVVGHNPDISYFGEYLTGDSKVEFMGNATVIQIQFENLDWEAVSEKTGKLIQRTDI